MNLNDLVREALKDRAILNESYTIKYAFYADECGVCLTGYPQTSLGESEKAIETIEYIRSGNSITRHKFSHL